jgi:hypothetical protein
LNSTLLLFEGGYYHSDYSSHSEIAHSIERKIDAFYFEFYLRHSEILKLMWREKRFSLARWLSASGCAAPHYQLSARVPNICIVSLLLSQQIIAACKIHLARPEK